MVTDRDRQRPRRQRPRLGYLVKAFPRISETFILNEILELESQGFDLHIYTMTHSRDPKRHRLADRVRSPIGRVPEGLGLAAPSALLAHAWAAWQSPSRYVSTLIRVLRVGDLELVQHFLQASCLARRLDRDGVAHLHAGFVHAPGSVAWIVHQLTGRTFSVATHAKDLYHSPPALLRRKLAAARIVFTCTRYNVAFLRTVCDRPGFLRVRRVYHGTNLGRFRFEPCGLADPPLILAVARLVEKKGLEDLVRACALLRDRHRRFRCRIVGAGPLHDRLDRLIRDERLEQVISLEGALDQEEVLAWYRQATMVVAPCLVTRDGDRDGIPNALVEAAACGVPIVSTPVSGIPELVEDRRTGLLVPPCDPTALALAIDELLASPELREALRCNARARVEAELDLRRNAREIGRALNEVMTRATRQRSHASKTDKRLKSA